MRIEREIGIELMFMTLKNNKFTARHNITEKPLLNHIKKSHGVNVIGFYIVKRVRRWDIEKYITNYTDFSDKIKYNVLRKQMTKDKVCNCC